MPARSALIVPRPACDSILCCPGRERSCGTLTKLHLIAASDAFRSTGLGPTSGLNFTALLNGLATRFGPRRSSTCVQPAEPSLSGISPTTWSTRRWATAARLRMLITCRSPKPIGRLPGDSQIRSAVTSMPINRRQQSSRTQVFLLLMTVDSW